MANFDLRGTSNANSPTGFRQTLTVTSNANFTSPTPKTDFVKDAKRRRDQQKLDLATLQYKSDFLKHFETKLTRQTNTLDAANDDGDGQSQEALQQ